MKKGIIRKMRSSKDAGSKNVQAVSISLRCQLVVLGLPLVALAFSAVMVVSALIETS